MARWHGIRPAEARLMLLPDFWMLDGFLSRNPPADLLIASYLSVKGIEVGQNKPREVTTRQRARKNADALAAMPPRRNVKSLSQMPEFLRTPAKMKLIEEQKAQWQTS